MIAQNKTKDFSRNDMLLEFVIIMLPHYSSGKKVKCCIALNVGRLFA